MNCNTWPWFAGVSRRLVVFVYFVLLAVAGCNPSSSAERKELSGLLHAVERLQTADKDQKLSLLLELQNRGCTNYCSYRAQCLGAHKSHAQGIEATEAARRLLENPSPTEKQWAQAGALLLAAERRLGRAREAIARCITQGAVLNRQLRRQN